MVLENKNLKTETATRDLTILIATMELANIDGRMGLFTMEIFNKMK